MQEEKLINRPEYLEKLIKWSADTTLIKIITGVRRCGKSTLLKLLINDLIEDGVSPKSILNINLDAPMFIPFWHDVSQIRLIVERAEALTGEKVEYLFLDEVQQMENWEVFVK